MSDEGPSEGGMLDYRSPQFYIVILENVSVFLAFSGLLNFYHAVQEDLSWWVIYMAYEYYMGCNGLTSLLILLSVNNIGAVRFPSSYASSE